MNKINFQALGDFVVCESPEVKETTDSGIIKSESMIKAEENSQNTKYLKVLSAGINTEFKIGDMIIVNNILAGITIDGIECAVISKQMVIGKKL